MATVRVEWGGPNDNLGAVRGPGGRVVWVRYLPREPRAPKTPRPARVDEWPTSAAFAELVCALSAGRIRRPWRVRIVGVRARIRCRVCRRVAAAGPPMALVTAAGSIRYRSGAVARVCRAASPGDHPPGDTMWLTPGDLWAATPARYFDGDGVSFGVFVRHLRGGVQRERCPGIVGWGGLIGTYSECMVPGEGAGASRARPRPPRRVSGPHFASRELAAWLRAAAAALGRRASAAAHYAVLD